MIAVKIRLVHIIRFFPCEGHQINATYTCRIHSTQAAFFQSVLSGESKTAQCTVMNTSLLILSVLLVLLAWCQAGRPRGIGLISRGFHSAVTS